MERSFRATKRFYWLLAGSFVLLIVLVVGSVWLMKRLTGNVRELRQMSLYVDVECEAVVVRNERLFTESASESHILLSEGATVSEGDAIAVLYPYSYESQIAAICTREAALYTHLQSLLRTAGSGNLPDSVVRYGEQISAVSHEMRAASNGETDAVRYASLEQELLRLQKERRNVMIAALEDPTMVQAEVDEIDAMIAAFENGSARTILSAYNGYISFYSDANEENLRDVSQLTVPLIKRILNTPSIPMDNENFSYRIVTDRTTFYLAFQQSATSTNRVMPGQTYSFTIKGVKGAYQGKVLTESCTDSGVLYIMQVNADVRPLLTTRVVEISIQNNASGLYVPVDYLQMELGMPYIYAKTTNGTFQKVPVYIAGSDGENAIVSARNSNISLFAGLKVRVPPEED